MPLLPVLITADNRGAPERVNNFIYLLLLEMETKPKKSFYNKERYEKNEDEILKNRREKYRTQHNKDLVNIKVCKGTFTLYFD